MVKFYCIHKPWNKISKIFLIWPVFFLYIFYWNWVMIPKNTFILTTEKTQIKDGQVFIWKTWSVYSMSASLFPLNSLSFYQLDAGEQHQALQVHPFFIWRLTTLASSSSRGCDPVLSQKGVAWRNRARAEGEGERGGEVAKWREGVRKQGGNSA